MNDNTNFNQLPLQMISHPRPDGQQYQQHPYHPQMRFESILKAPANFRDSALYSNDPTDPMFSYHLAQQLGDGNNGLQPGSASVNQSQHPSSQFYQPSYSNIPGKSTIYYQNSQRNGVDQLCFI